jgi:hypothetical protein
LITGGELTMRYMTRRDLAVVAATSIGLAVIGFGIYFSLNYTIVRAKGVPESNVAVAKKESPTPLQSNPVPVAKQRTAEKPKKFSDHVVQLKSQPEQPLVAVASPVVETAPITTEVAPVYRAAQPERTARPEPSNETWQPSPQSQVWSDNARNYPPTSYEQPRAEQQEKRGMTRKEKIVVGSAIGGAIITSILLARRHR